MEIPSSATKHLHYFQICVFLDTIVLKTHSILNDDQVAWQIDSNGKRGRATDHVYLSFEETRLNGMPIREIETGMMEGYARGKSACESLA